MRYQKRDDLSCRVLWELSIGLNHNLFQDVAALLPQGFPTDAPDPTVPLQERIVILEEENKLLRAQMETLMKVVRK